jgi:hypothetical protein
MDKHINSSKEKMPYKRPIVEKIAIDTQISLAMGSEAPPAGMDEESYLDYRKEENKEMC